VRAFGQIVLRNLVPVKLDRTLGCMSVLRQINFAAGDAPQNGCTSDISNGCSHGQCGRLDRPQYSHPKTEAHPAPWSASLSIECARRATNKTLTLCVHSRHKNEPHPASWVVHSWNDLGDGYRQASKAYRRMPPTGQDQPSGPRRAVAQTEAQGKVEMDTMECDTPSQISRPGSHPTQRRPPVGRL
jgi:hypothetical protein